MKTIQIDFQLHRPGGFSGEGDQYLPEVVKSLKRRLGKAQGLLKYDTLHLPDCLIEKLASDEVLGFCFDSLPALEIPAKFA